MHQSQPGRPGVSATVIPNQNSEESLESTFRPSATTANGNPAIRFINWLEKYLLVLVIGGLFAGIGVASISQPLVDKVDSIINVFMDLYDFVAPIAIFLILTPNAASKIARARSSPILRSNSLTAFSACSPTAVLSYPLIPSDDRTG